MILMSVDLPAPLSPTTASTCPAKAARSTPARATTWPNRLLMPRSSRSAARAPGSVIASPWSGRVLGGGEGRVQVGLGDEGGAGIGRRRHLLALAHRDEQVDGILGHGAEVLLAGAVDRPAADAVDDLRGKVIDHAEHLAGLALLF